jgi:UDPglucose--hexose-1-phosphate uridylyltransferase
MRRTAARLADGREIIYFDDRENAPRELDDRRDLPPRSNGSELRYDAALDEWVVIASHRQNRTHLPPSDECPLCPSTVDRRTEIPSSHYDVVVFENRFASLQMPVESVERSAEGSTESRPAIGRCEVVCFTSDHNSSFAALSPERVRTVVDAWIDRTTEMGKLPGVEEVFCFENRGQEIGVTLSHPHGQIYAYPFVTPRTRRMLESARAHRDRVGSNLFADLLAAEVADGRRIIASTSCWTAFVPVAARWPFEIHLYPNRQVPDLPALTPAERDDFAVIYLDVLRRLDGVFGLPMPYISAWHQAPVRTGRELSYLHLELFSIRRAPGKLKYLAGSESGMGVFINDIPPETAAEMLREAAGNGAADEEEMA